jgi:hypothetical protein
VKNILIGSVLVIGLSTVVVGCGDNTGGSAGNTVTMKREAWDPRKVKVACPSGDCPPGVGAAMFVEKTDNNMIKLGRCTASLIAPDKILMNAHCDLEMTPDLGLFFFNVDGETKIYELGTREWRTFDYSSIDSKDIGAGEDLEVYNLRDSVTEVAPRSISRAVPADMSQLIAYVSNNPSKDGMALELDREVCQTQSHIDPHSNPMQGGVQDMTVGIFLQCQVIPGNSGSPAFAPGNMQDIQVVINAGNPNTPVDGYANRVQCMDLPGITDVAQTCHRVFAALQPGQTPPFAESILQFRAM